MDVFDHFSVSVGVPQYTGALWLYGSTNGVVSLGGTHTKVAGAQEALVEFTQEVLDFHEVRHGLEYVAAVYKAKKNVALVFHEDRIVAMAELPLKWFPPGDPRRGVG